MKQPIILLLAVLGNVGMAEAEILTGKCVALNTVSIANSVTTIGVYAFYNSTALSFIYNHANVPQTMGSNVFSEVNVNGVNLHVPVASVETYRTSNGMEEFQRAYARACYRRNVQYRFGGAYRRLNPHAHRNS